MPRFIRLLLLGTLLIAGIHEVRAERYQVVLLHVELRRLPRVDGVQVPFAELTSAVASRIRGNDALRVKISFRIGAAKEFREEVMNRCRAAGATSFVLLYKS